MEGIEHERNVVGLVAVRCLPKRRFHDRAASERFNRQISPGIVVQGLCGL